MSSFTLRFRQKMTLADFLNCGQRPRLSTSEVLVQRATNAGCTPAVAAREELRTGGHVDERAEMIKLWA